MKITTKKSILISFFIYFAMNITGQDLPQKTQKWVYGISIFPGLNSYNDNEMGDINTTVSPKIQYFVRKNFSIYMGADLGYGVGWGYKNPTKTKLITVSLGARYYLFKKRWLFTELGYQSGNYMQNNNDSSFHTPINQMGLGLGLSFNLAHHPGIGRFTFEYLFRINKSFQPYDIRKDYYGAKRFLGSGFGFHYYFDPSRPPQKAISEEDSHIKPLHVIKASGNPSIDYTFELPLANSLCLNNSLMLNNLAYLFEDTAMLFVQLNIEPRWYYGYKKRMQRNQITTNNSSDFLSLSLLTTHRFTEVKMKNATMFTMLPKWGLRRALGRHFIFEFALGYAFSQAYYEKKWYFTSQPFLNYYLGYVF